MYYSLLVVYNDTFLTPQIVSDFQDFTDGQFAQGTEIGDDLGMPSNLVHKAPSDGMSGSTDEDKLGFTYQELDDLLLGTGSPCEETRAKIEHLHRINLHKLQPMPKFIP